MRYTFLLPRLSPPFPSFFFFNDTAPTEIYPLSLHDALPISHTTLCGPSMTSAATSSPRCAGRQCTAARKSPPRDRKSTRLNSSHQIISYAVFCLKKKKRPPRYLPHRPTSPPSAALPAQQTRS